MQIIDIRAYKGDAVMDAGRVFISTTVALDADTSVPHALVEVMRRLQGETQIVLPTIETQIVLPHASDCATHNEPAFEAGPCDCEAPSDYEDVTDKEWAAYEAGNREPEPAPKQPEPEQPVSSRRRRSPEAEVAQLPAVQQALAEAVQEAQAEQPASRRRRAPAEAAVEAPAAPEAPPVEEQPRRRRATAEEPKHPTARDVLLAVQNAAEFLTPKVVLELLGEFGAETTSGVKEEDREEFLRVIAEEVAAARTAASKG